MKIFISWSGDLSHKVALELQEWLPNVLQQVTPYVSSVDIEKGSKWFSDISEELESCDFGILCLTKSNMKEPWILFEAGALSKKLKVSKVVPLLIDFEPSELEGPLVQFQATLVKRDDVFKLLKSINKNLGEASLENNRLNKSFKKWWDELDTKIDKIKKQNAEASDGESKRSDREIIEETLEIVRAIRRNSQNDLEEKIAFLRDRKPKTFSEIWNEKKQDDGNEELAKALKEFLKIYRKDQ